jgi:hypothetical protein
VQSGGGAAVSFNGLLGGASEAFDIVELTEFFVERSEWDMSSLARRLEHHAIRKAKFGASAESSQGSGNYVGILQNEISMVEQHVNGGAELLVGELEDRVEDPNHLDQDDVGDPSTLRYERLSSRGLARIVSGEKANDDVGVNGAHDAWPRHGVDRSSVRPTTSEGRLEEKAQRVFPRRNALPLVGRRPVHHPPPTRAQSLARGRACAEPRQVRRSDLEQSAWTMRRTYGHITMVMNRPQTAVVRPTYRC